MNSNNIIIIIINAIVMLAIIAGISLYNRIRYYAKPKYRINKKTKYIEYYHYIYHHWYPVCGWDNESSPRTCILHQIDGSKISFNYNGPGRYYFTCNDNTSLNDIKKQFTYNSTKELYDQQVEYINNENIIISKIINGN